ncbi:MAG: hypothetical protein ACQ9ET_03395 [Nitrosomonadaceae bacterium]
MDLFTVLLAGILAINIVYAKERLAKMEDTGWYFYIVINFIGIIILIVKLST